VLLSTGICFQSAIVFSFFLVVSEGTWAFAKMS
jgi:hypothetical protein